MHKVNSLQKQLIEVGLKPHKLECEITQGM